MRTGSSRTLPRVEEDGSPRFLETGWGALYSMRQDSGRALHPPPVPQLPERLPSFSLPTPRTGLQADPRLPSCLGLPLASSASQNPPECPGPGISPGLGALRPPYL